MKQFPVSVLAVIGEVLALATSTATRNQVTEWQKLCFVTEISELEDAVEKCNDIVLFDLYAPPSVSINLSGLQTGAIVTFAGRTTFGTTPDDNFNPIVVSGDNITVQGAPGSIIDGNGQAYWDGLGSNGGRPKPDHFFVVHNSNGVTIKDLYIQNYPVHCFDISYISNVAIYNLNLNNAAGDAPNSLSDGKRAAHNTDGFDISNCVNCSISNTFVQNQDDCVAVTSGSSIKISGMTCIGGHGLSIGSVGGKRHNTVSDVTFSDSRVINSHNGCRIKTNANTTGLVENIIYQDIVLRNISVHGIVVEQDYLNGGPTGVPTNGVKIDGVTFRDVRGTVSGSSAYDYYILCGNGSCSNFHFEAVYISGGEKSCNYPPSGCPTSKTWMIEGDDK